MYYTIRLHSRSLIQRVYFQNLFYEIVSQTYMLDWAIHSFILIKRNRNRMERFFFDTIWPITFRCRSPHLSEALGHVSTHCLIHFDYSCSRSQSSAEPIADVTVSLNTGTFLLWANSMVNIFMCCEQSCYQYGKNKYQHREWHFDTGFELDFVCRCHRPWQQQSKYYRDHFGRWDTNSKTHFVIKFLWIFYLPIHCDLRLLCCAKIMSCWAEVMSDQIVQMKCCNHKCNFRPILCFFFVLLGSNCAYLCFQLRYKWFTTLGCCLRGCWSVVQT